MDRLDQPDRRFHCNENTLTHRNLVDTFCCSMQCYDVWSFKSPLCVWFLMCVLVDFCWGLATVPFFTSTEYFVLSAWVDVCWAITKIMNNEHHFMHDFHNVNICSNTFLFKFAINYLFIFSFLFALRFCFHLSLYSNLYVFFCTRSIDNTLHTQRHHACTDTIRDYGPAYGATVHVDTDGAATESKRILIPHQILIAHVDAYFISQIYCKHLQNKWTIQIWINAFTKEGMFHHYYYIHLFIYIFIIFYYGGERKNLL